MSSSATPVTVRLTRRGRLVVLALITAITLAMLVMGAASVSAVASAPVSAASSRTVVVQPGQTLWELAVEVAPDRDPRDVVKQISDLNGLVTPLLAPGQSLSVPVV